MPDPDLAEPAGVGGVLPAEMLGQERAGALGLRDALRRQQNGVVGLGLIQRAVDIGLRLAVAHEVEVEILIGHWRIPKIA